MAYGGFSRRRSERGQGPNDALHCEQCGKAYRVIPQEKSLCAKMGVEEATKCLQCMDQQLLSWKNPRFLWQRSCDHCGSSMQSSYSPDRPEKVYCDACYSRMVY